MVWAFLVQRFSGQLCTPSRRVRKGAHWLPCLPSMGYFAERATLAANGNDRICGQDNQKIASIAKPGGDGDIGVWICSGFVNAWKNRNDGRASTVGYRVGTAARGFHNATKSATD
ncbi:uncharacterized protein METZ01_LOCUS277972 [marine metagenome]|uniref:Uncharacterized protein n=1 Tax=marine metagenome TaxID=408172 RepID=A0A382KKX9_9ZZZZ